MVPPARRRAAPARPPRAAPHPRAPRAPLRPPQARPRPGRAAPRVCGGTSTSPLRGTPAAAQSALCTGSAAAVQAWCSHGHLGGSDAPLIRWQMRAPHACTAALHDHMLMSRARARAHLRRRQLRRVVGRRGADGALQVVRAAAEAQHAHRQRALRRRARRRRPLRASACRGRTALCPSSQAAEAPACSAAAACSSECLGSRPSIAAASNCGATNGCGHMLTQSDAANYCAAIACSREG